MPKRATSRKPKAHPSPASPRWETATVGLDESDLIDPAATAEEHDRHATELAYARAEAWALSPPGTPYSSIVIPTMQACAEKSK